MKVIILLAAKSLLTRLWRTDRTLNVSELIALINLIYYYKKAITLRTNSLSKLKQMWNPWIQMLSHNDI